MNDLQSTLKLQRDRRLVEGVVANVALFRGLAAAQVGALAAQCASYEARRGDVIVQLGARVPGIYVVAYGTVKIALRSADNGGERVLRLVQAGQTFAETAALTGHPAPYEAYALAACKLVVIPTAAVYAQLDRDPRAARQIVHALAERCFELLAELQSASMRRGAQRLASYLDSLAAKAQPEGACKVTLPASKTLIASRLDMKKETLSRLLRALAERGLIEVAQREVTILDRQSLGDLARI